MGTIKLNSEAIRAAIIGKKEKKISYGVRPTRPNIGRVWCKYHYGAGYKKIEIVVPFRYELSSFGVEITHAETPNLNLIVRLNGQQVNNDYTHVVADIRDNDIEVEEELNDILEDWKKENDYSAEHLGVIMKTLLLGPQKGDVVLAQDEDGEYAYYNYSRKESGTTLRPDIDDMGDLSPTTTLALYQCGKHVVALVNQDTIRNPHNSLESLQEQESWIMGSLDELEEQLKKKCLDVPEELRKKVVEMFNS